MSDFPDLRDPDLPAARKRSAVSLVDDALLVVVALVGALIVLKVLSAIASTIFFAMKLLAIAAVFFIVFRVVRSRLR